MVDVFFVARSQSYATVVKIYTATSSLVRYENHFFLLRETL
jgi:hypothetical protein